MALLAGGVVLLAGAIAVYIRKRKPAAPVQTKDVFGVSLQQSIANFPTDSCLPIVLEESFRVLGERDGGSRLTTEGIFRISGSQREVDELKALYNNGDIPENLASYSPYTIGSLIKRYLLDLPDPVFPEEHYSMLISQFDAKLDEWLCSMRAFLNSLPEENQFVLFHLFGLLKRTAELSELNKMTSSNLARVFGPSLIRSNTQSLENSLADAPKIVAITQRLIDHYESVFDYVKHQLGLQGGEESYPIDTVVPDPEK